MLKGRMPRRWPMMTREDSSVLELSIYSEGSSSSGDDDDDDDLCSEWSEWEDPLWVKDDNLRRPRSPVNKKAQPRRRANGGVVSPRTLGRAKSQMGRRTSSGSLAQLFVNKQLSSVALQLPGSTTITMASLETLNKAEAKSDAMPPPLSISVSLSFEGQESGAVTPTSSSSSSASCVSSASTPRASPSSLVRGRKTGTTSLMTAVVEECWSFEGSSSILKSVSDLDEHIDDDDDDDDDEKPANNSTTSSPSSTKSVEQDDEGSIEEEEERDPCSDEGSEDDDEFNGEEVEEKGIEYLLKKYYPDSPALTDEQSTPTATENDEKKTKEKKKRKHGKKGEKKDKLKKKKERKNKDKGQDRTVPDKEEEEREISSVVKGPTGAARGLVFSVDHMILERRDAAREKYKSLFIPSLDLKRSDAGSDSDCDVDNAGSCKSSPATTRRKGSQRVRKGERERRMPQSARASFGRKSARELGMILRCGSREDVTDDECNIITAATISSSAAATPISPRTNSHGSSSSVRIRSLSQGSELKTMRAGEEAQPSPRSKGKHSWVIKRENAPARELPRGGSHIERGQVYGKLSVSTSSFLTPLTNVQRRPDSSGEQSATDSAGVLSPRKKSGSIIGLLSGRRGSQGEALRRDASSTEGLASSSSSLSSHSSGVSTSSMSNVSPSGLGSDSGSSSSQSPSSSSSSSSTSSPSMMRRGRSSSLNKAAGIFKRSGSVRTARDKKTTTDENSDSSNNNLASDGSRSSAVGGDQPREKLVGLKKSWREVKSYFASDREVRTYFSGSASTPATPKQPPYS